MGKVHAHETVAAQRARDALALALDGRVASMRFGECVTEALLALDHRLRELEDSEPTEESTAQQYSNAIQDVLIDFGCAPPEGLCLESQARWLREQLALVVELRTLLLEFGFAVACETDLTDAIRFLRDHLQTKTGG